MPTLFENVKKYNYKNHNGDFPRKMIKEPEGFTLRGERLKQLNTNTNEAEKKRDCDI